MTSLMAQTKQRLLGTSLAAALLMLLSALPIGTSYAEPRLDLSARTPQGELRSLKQYEGKVVYVDFWASWCAPCRDSFPWMEQMHQRYAKQGLAIVAINLDSEGEMANPFLADFTTSFDILYDPKGEVAGHFNLQGMPSSYLFDAKGQLVSEHLGFFKSKQPAVEQEIKALLRQRNANEK